MSSLLYVACTRVTRLENLFVSAIHPCVWKKIGQTDMDRQKREVDDKLCEAAKEFAWKHGKYKETLQELEWTTDGSNNDAEWRLLQEQTHPPKKRGKTLQQSTSDTDFDVCLGDTSFRMFSKPVLSERHIGIDQGEKNFAIVVVERTVGNNPNIVAANNYADLELEEHFKAAYVLMALAEKTDLLSWMKPVYNEHKVDRVIVHLEQMDSRNQNSKQFGVALGKLLQQQMSDTETCIVKMSQPHIHRATGPMFHLGHEIVEKLELKPALYQQTRSRAESNPAVVGVQRDVNDSELADVEPSDPRPEAESRDRTQYSAYAERCRDNTELGHGLTKKAIKHMCFNEFAKTVNHKWINAKRAKPTDIDQTTKRKIRTRDLNSGHWKLTKCRRRKITVMHTEPSDPRPAAGSRDGESAEYRMKKKMSSKVFRYIVEAGDEQLQQMKLTMDSSVQQYWHAKLTTDPSVKLDDVGDALLHALDELLCGSTNFKQLLPAAPSVHVNRTVGLVVFLRTTHWIVLSCRSNTFLLENIGCFTYDLCNRIFKDPSTVETIKRNITHCNELWSALSDFEGSPLTYDAVDHIKVVVKQLTSHTDLGLSNKEAGALTESTRKAIKLICDDVMGVNSKLCQRHDKVFGSMYSRTSALHKDRKFQVMNSTGKHTNAVVSCLSWMKENVRDFVERRGEFLDEHEKNKFCSAILDTAHSSGNSLGMLQLSNTVRVKLSSDEVKHLMEIDGTFGRNIADIVLIAMSKNQQNVKAIAANSRKRPASPRLQAHKDDVEL